MRAWESVSRDTKIPRTRSLPGCWHPRFFPRTGPFRRINTGLLRASCPGALAVGEHGWGGYINYGYMAWGQGGATQMGADGKGEVFEG